MSNNNMTITIHESGFATITIEGEDRRYQTKIKIKKKRSLETKKDILQRWKGDEKTIEAYRRIGRSNLKHKQYRERCKKLGLCPHCGKPVKGVGQRGKYTECEERRLYKKANSYKNFKHKATRNGDGK